MNSSSFDLSEYMNKPNGKVFSPEWKVPIGKQEIIDIFNSVPVYSNALVLLKKHSNKKLPIEAFKGMLMTEIRMEFGNIEINIDDMCEYLINCWNEYMEEH